jgi:signal peptidase I, bacterial type
MSEPITVEQAKTKKLKKGEKEKKPLDIKKEILSWILTLGAAVLIALVIRTFLFEPVKVDGGSMLDTLSDKEVMFVTKPEYLFGDPKHGDVIICRYPERTEYFVKRVIAVPGDNIYIDGVNVFVNDEKVDDHYLSSERNRFDHTMSEKTLGTDEYFVMGDNRDNSNDSRSVGPLHRDQIIGHVRYVIFPFNQIRPIE